MSLTRSEAYDEALALVKTAWDATGFGARAKWDNVGAASTPFTGTDPWIRTTFRNTTGFQATLTSDGSGGVGGRRFRRLGILTVQVFEATGQGMIDGTDYVQTIVDALEGVTSAGGIIFRDVIDNPIGPSGGFFQTNVVATYEYDEIK